MNKPKAQTSSTESAPWAAQQPFMTDGMQSALDIYKQGQQTGPYTGAYSAGMNPTQQSGYGAAVDYARGPGAALAGQAGQNAGALMGATQPFLSNAGQLAANGAGGLNATAAGVLSGAASGQTLGQTTTAGSAGLAAQQGALATSQGLASRASGDPNAAVLAGARGYVDNDLLQGQVDAATRDVARTLGEETLPGLNARAMAGGNVNSARAGAAEAVARRGAEDRAADISASMRGDAYKTGLATSLAAQEQQNALALGANAQTASLGGALSGLGEGQRQFNGSQQVDAASSLGALSLQSQQINANTRLQANGQLGQAALSGIDAANAAGSLSDANTARLVTAGDAYQAEQNRQLQEAQAQFYAPQEYAQQQLANYWSVVGNPIGKSETTTTSAPQGMGMLQGALGGAAAGAGLYSALKPSGALSSPTKDYVSVGGPKSK